MNRTGIHLAIEELANLLFYWVERCVDGPQIKKAAGELAFDIDDRQDYYSAHQLLLVLNMWLVVSTCQSRLQGWNGLFDCMQLFHRLVYTRSVRGDECDYARWLKFVADCCDDYNREMRSCSPSTRLLGVAKVTAKSIFGDDSTHPIAIFKMSAYIAGQHNQLSDFIECCQMH
jgi:hypothetical protein